MNKEHIILINSGNMFEGTCDQFEDCFFSFPDDLTIEEKLSEVKDWCNKEGYTFSWSYDLTPYQKADGSTWLGNQMIFAGSQKNRKTMGAENAIVCWLLINTAR